MGLSKAQTRIPWREIINGFPDPQVLPLIVVNIMNRCSEMIIRKLNFRYVYADY